MNEPQWLEDVVSDYECLKDVLGDKKPAGWMQHHEQLLAHVRELREALSMQLDCPDHEGYPCSTCSNNAALLNRQEPPEISEEE